MVLVLLITPLPAGGAWGGARAIPVSRIEVEAPPPAGVWAKIFPPAAELWRGVAGPLEPAEAGGDFGGARGGVGGGGGGGAPAGSARAVGFVSACAEVRPS